MTLNDFKINTKGYFFNKDTISFWGSKIEFWNPNSGFFITSENNYEKTERLFTIRKANFKELTVENISDFQEYNTLKDAKKILKGINNEVN